MSLGYRYADSPIVCFESAAAACGMPLKVLKLNEEHAHSVYKKELLLIRPDQHVAWRGGFGPFVPEEAERVINLVRGA